MNFFQFLTRFICIASLVGISTAYADTLSAVGTWKTIDDEIKKPKSIVKIWESKGEIKGKVLNVIYYPGEEKHALCDKCPGEWHNQKIVGMTFLWGFKQNPENPLQWKEGKILDPKTGKIYSCQMTLTEDGKSLNVRGYIGMPLLGRTQTWLREDND